jgi:two-component system, NtrC family, response regulator GlrR
MKPPDILIINLSKDDWNDELRAIFDGHQIVFYDFPGAGDEADREARLKSKILEADFDVLLLTLAAETVADAEKLIDSEIFKNLRQPKLLCAGNVPSEKLFKLLSGGIDDFVVAPFKKEDVLPRIRRLLPKDDLQEKLIKKSKEKIGLKRIIGKNPAFIGEIDKLPIFARCDVAVLITGETGTGKEIIARAIHYLSSRADKSFVPINCGAIPNDLMENELFGHERGAFTGALHSQKGLIYEADGGTLFLDEIDSLPLISQVKLLRFLQDKEYRPLGSTKPRKADVRIIAASSRNLEEMVESEKLRADLYYRLNVMQIILPPLRERPEDVPLLARHFLEKYTLEFKKDIDSIEPEALLKLQNSDWRGNVRELENIIERAVLLSESATITAADLKLNASKKEKLEESFRTAKARAVARFEKSYLQKILEIYQGNISQAAKVAGKNRRAFFELIRKHRINVENFKSN